MRKESNRQTDIQTGSGTVKKIIEREAEADRQKQTDRQTFFFPFFVIFKIQLLSNPSSFTG